MRQPQPLLSHNFSMLRHASLIFSFLFLMSCGKKREIITPENLTSVLTRYGQENPENEVIIETKFGNIRLKLYDNTPLHRANFIKLIKEDHYDNSTFYRIVSEFMIQGGNTNKKLTYTIPAELNAAYFHKKGALAMARFDENNPEMRSSAAEFYIVQGTRYDDWSLDEESKRLGITLTPEQQHIYKTLGGYMSLDKRYTVFGEVVEGLDVIDKIAREKVFDIDKPLREIPFEIKVVERSN